MNIDAVVDNLRLSVRSGVTEQRALFEAIASLPLTDIPTSELLEHLRKFLHPAMPHAVGVKIVFDNEFQTHSERVPFHRRADTMIHHPRAEKLNRMW